MKIKPLYGRFLLLLFAVIACNTATTESIPVNSTRMDCGTLPVKEPDAPDLLN